MTEDTFVNHEVASFWRLISNSLDRLLALAENLDSAGLTWQPPAPETNSIYALTMHTMGNAEENILQTLCGQPAGREWGPKFAQVGPGALMAERWHDLRPRLVAALAHIAPGELDQDRAHPRRGTITGRDVLIVVARHAAEHLGQAELTRDLRQATRLGQEAALLH